jgi:hypothetical protein
MINYKLLKNFGHEHLVGYVGDINFWKKYNIKREWLNDPYWFQCIESYGLSQPLLSKMVHIGIPANPVNQVMYTESDMIAFGAEMARDWGHFYPNELAARIFRQKFIKEKR